MEESIDLDSDNICGICYAEFLDIEDLKLHITQYHLNETSKHRFCKFCSSIFPDIISFVLHIRNFHLSSLNVCKYCTRVYSDRHSLTRHEKKHKSSFYFPKIACSHCIRVFENKKELETHEYEKHRESDDGWMLQYCYPELSSIININIRKFIQGMNENYLYRCIVCLFSTPDVNNYVYHLITKKCESFACDLCCNVYSRMSKLRTHCKSHKEYKEAIARSKEKCPKCDKYFHCTNLKSHLKNCKSLKCIPCDVTFDSVVKFAEHATTHSHRTPVQFENCKYCRRPFIGLKTLQTHIEKSHKHNMHLYKYRCIYCDLIFKHPKLLFGHFFTRHRDISPYRCLICDKHFRIRKNFTLHIKLFHKSVGFVEFDSNYHVFFADKKSENPFQPKNPDVDDPPVKNPKEGTSTASNDLLITIEEENIGEVTKDNVKLITQNLEAKCVPTNKDLTEILNKSKESETANETNSVEEIVDKEAQPHEKVDANMEQESQPLNESLDDKSPGNNNSKEDKLHEISHDTTNSVNNKETVITEISSDTTQFENNEGTKISETGNDTIQQNNKETKVTEISNDTTQCENNEETRANETNDKIQSNNENSKVKLVNVNSDFMTVTETEADQTENDGKRKTRRKRKQKVPTHQPRKRRRVKLAHDPYSSDSDVPLSKIVNKTKTKGAIIRRVRKRKPRAFNDAPSKKLKFICFKCERNCYTYQNYHRHMSLHMKNGSKTCVKCFEKFKTKERLHDHMKTAHSSSKLTETLKKLLDKRKSYTVEEPTLPESEISKTIQKVDFKTNDSQATITRVENDKLSVKRFLETFKPDSSDTNKKISISNNLSIRPVINARTEPFIRMNKFKEDTITNDRPQLKMPVKFREENLEQHKVTIKLVHCDVVPANFDNEVTVSDTDNIDQFDESYEAQKSETIPEVGREILLENTDSTKIKLLTKTIVLKDLLSYNNVRIGHLAPKAPFYKIVKIDDVLQEKQDKVEPPKPVNITLPNGTKLVSVNPLAHLLGNKTVADIPKSNPYKNKPYSYKPKTRDFREAIVKAMKVLDKVPPKRKNTKNVNPANS